MTDQNLNPDIREVHVGVKTLRKTHVYPLSLHDQEQLTGIVVGFVNSFSDINFNDISNEKALELIKDFIKDNLFKIMEFVIEEKERPTLIELTNNQFYQIVNDIFEVNYEGLIKNFQDLFKRAKNLMDRQKN